MRRAVIADIIKDCGSVLCNLMANRALAVENPHRILFKPAETGRAKLVFSRFKIFTQSIVIILAAFGAAD